MAAPKKVGDKAYYKFITKCMFNDWCISQPLGDCTRYDCILDREGALERVQVKTGRYRKGRIKFATASTNHYVRNGKVIHAERTSYRGQIEYFGIYCFELDKCYLVPVDIMGITTGFLRVDPLKSKNGNKIYWAKDFEI